MDQLLLNGSKDLKVPKYSLITITGENNKRYRGRNESKGDIVLVKSSVLFQSSWVIRISYF